MSTPSQRVLLPEPVRRSRSTTAHDDTFVHFPSHVADVLKLSQPHPILPLHKVPAQTDTEQASYGER